MAKQTQCERALDQYESALTKLKNVVGLGIVKANDAGPAGDCAVAVYVKKKVAAAKLAAKDLAPAKLTIAGRGGKIDVPVRVIEQGEVVLEDHAGGMRG